MGKNWKSRRLTIMRGVKMLVKYINEYNVKYANYKKIL